MSIQEELTRDKRRLFAEKEQELKILFMYLGIDDGEYRKISADEARSLPRYKILKRAM